LSKNPLSILFRINCLKERIFFFDFTIVVGSRSIYFLPPSRNEEILKILLEPVVSICGSGFDNGLKFTFLSSLFVFLSVYLPEFLYLRLSTFLSVLLVVLLSVCLACLCVCSSVCLSACLFSFLSVYVSVCFTFYLFSCLCVRF